MKNKKEEEGKKEAKRPHNLQHPSRETRERGMNADAIAKSRRLSNRRMPCA